MTDPRFTLHLDTPELSLDVRFVRVEEALNQPFALSIVGLSAQHDADLDRVIGVDATLRLADGQSSAWTGLISEAALVASTPSGVSTFEVHLVPALWLLTQRRNHRAFQGMSEPDVAIAILREWQIEPVTRIDRSEHPKREMCVQYGESDYAFVSRMLERAGVSYWFELIDGRSRVVLADAPQAAKPSQSLVYRPEGLDVRVPHVLSFATSRELKAGRYVMRDVDLRRPSDQQPSAEAETDADSLEAQLERFHYVPGGFLVESAEQGETPVADDRLAWRTDERVAKRRAEMRLAAKRGRARIHTLETPTLDLIPGQTFLLLEHPSPALGADALLAVSSLIEARDGEPIVRRMEAVSAREPHVPRLATPSPSVPGVDTATVVGAAGDEIPTDELGRVRVHFHWNRYDASDDRSSAWLHVASSWAGAGYGAIKPPRAGQEVIVEYVGGDPDRPMITGRVYTLEQPVPYELPANKTQSGWRSSSTNFTGGFNELMFEDKSGQELVRMRAQRDMNTRVKRDERRAIDNDRVTTVAGDERRSVGNDRTRRIAGNGTKVVVGSSDGLTRGDTSETMASSYQSTVRANRSAFSGGNSGATVDKRDGHIAMHNDEEATEAFQLVTSKDGADTTVNMWPGRISLVTPGGAVVLDGPHVTVFSKYSVRLGAEGGVYIRSKDATKLSGDLISVNGPDQVTFDGGTVSLNLGGRWGSGLGHTAPATIEEGSVGVKVGGPSMPADMVRMNKEGTLIELDNGIVIDGRDVQYPIYNDKGEIIGRKTREASQGEGQNFVSLALANLGLIGDTESGKKQLEGIKNSGHTVTIKPTIENNGFASPDSKDSTVPGKGSDSTIRWNPAYTSGPPNMTPEERAKMPARVMFHELGHSRHMAHGVQDDTPRFDGFDDNEEYNTIFGDDPSEADFLKDVGIPWRRDDHDSTWVPNL